MVILDKYYTKLSIVDLVIEKIKENIKIKKHHLIIEPSAGNGAFINSIKQLTDNYLFYDLKPESNEITKLDYLTFDYTELKSKYSKVHIIGNPPFGKQSSLAIKFIKKSCEFCNTISFILPKSFKKLSLKKHFPLNFHLLLEYDLPKKSFLVNNVEYDVPCILQIWKKKNKTRIMEQIVTPNGFKFVKKTDNPDISFQRVGSKAGLIEDNNNFINGKSIQSNYFIKLEYNIENLGNLSFIIEKLKKIKFDIDNTVGPKSISKQELIKKFNQVLNPNSNIL
jgi:predicted RNA methylase